MHIGLTKFCLMNQTVLMVKNLNSIFDFGRNMKLNSIFIAILFLANLVSAQRREDFILKTDLKDTLFRGLQNELTIQTNLDPDKISVSGKGLSIKLNEQGKSYNVICSPALSKVVFQIGYKIDGKEPVFFDFEFRVSSITIDIANRIRAQKDMPPIKVGLSKYKSGQKVELILPPILPEFFTPVIISKNKRYAYLGNKDVMSGSVLDLNSRKLIVGSDKDTIILPVSGSVLSNTGRYIVSAYISSLGNELYLYRDLFSHTYITCQESELDYLYINLLEFSPDDEYTILRGFKNNDETEMIFHNVKNKTFTKFSLSGQKILAAEFCKNSNGLYGYSVNYERPNVILIDSIDYGRELVTLIDSIVLPVDPRMVKMEHNILITAYNDPEIGLPVIVLYKGHSNKVLARFELKPELADFYLENNEAYDNFHVDPDNHYLTYAVRENGKIKTFVGSIQRAEFNEKPIELYWEWSDPVFPVVLENRILFGEYFEPNQYIDEQRGVLFWHEIDLNLNENFKPPLVQFSNSWGYTGCKTCDVNGKKHESIVMNELKWKKGKVKVDNTINLKCGTPGQSTFRFGTILNPYSTGTNRHFGIFDFDLAKLHLTQHYEFKTYVNVNELESESFIKGADKFNLEIKKPLDAECRKEIGIEPELLQVHDKNHAIYSDIMEGGFLFYNKLKQTPAERLVRLKLFKPSDWIMYCDDRYYAFNFAKNPALQFGIEGALFPFEQFDLKYNRPDIILDRLGYSDSATIALYHSAYLKRLKKMNFTEDMLQDDADLPELKIKNTESIPLYTDSLNLDLDIEIQDYKYKLDRLNIYLNDVPVYGSAGIDLRKKNAYNYKGKFKIELANGENKIQVSALNQAGVESYKETIFVNHQVKELKQPTLYLVSIGDSKYTDSRFDLTYASKDALDVAKAFEKSKIFVEVIKYTLVNEQVTKDNILKLKKELAKAKRDDVVMITVAGHGVLDKDLNYYLATYDMDFNNPAEKGLPYEDLESLVDGIAPLKKVLFLDACHSGEVDKEEVEQLAMNSTSTDDVKFRAAGAGIQKKNLGLKTTSELMGELFTDLRRGTGATVISSAGGAEYAMESDQWKNGLFTYCLLHGLKDKAADANNDGQIMLSELQQYLRTEVTKLSNGAQQPTSRIENLSMDFRIW
jgi:hypothetical protein